MNRVEWGTCVSCEKSHRVRIEWLPASAIEAGTGETSSCPGDGCEGCDGCWDDGSTEGESAGPKDIAQ